MKNVILLSILVSSLSGFAQMNESPNVLSKGNITIDAYYGTGDYLNVFSYLFDKNHRIYTQSRKDKGMIKTIGSLGVKGTYLVRERIGVGLVLDYKQYYTKGLYFNTNEIAQEVYRTYYSLLPTFSYHFYKNEKFDLGGVIGFGLGYHTVKPIAYKEGYSSTELSYFNLESVLGLTSHYYFTDHFGLNASMLLGVGGFINGGISYKF
jgi:hypothetical protein